MKRINLILQGKGGVGKSLIASLLTQYLQNHSSGEPIFCADTDPINRTFAGYKTFDVQVIKLLNADSNVDPREFDVLIEQLASTTQDAVIDNGAATFLPLSSYLFENSIVELLAGFDKQVVIHCVVTGGQSQMDTLSGLLSILEYNPAQVVIWKNNYFGDVSVNGCAIEDLPVLKKFKEKILGFVTLDKLTQDTFGKDMQIMITNKLTFAEAMESDLFTMMPRQRLKIIERKINDQLENIGF